MQRLPKFPRLRKSEAPRRRLPGGCSAEADYFRKMSTRWSVLRVRAGVTEPCIMLIRARHYASGEIVDITCARGRVASITAPGKSSPDCTAGWAAPAFFDLQI